MLQARGYDEYLMQHLTTYREQCFINRSVEMQPDLKGVTYESVENCCFIGLMFTSQVFVDLIFLNITASKRTPRGACYTYEHR